jgi:hypothetical protein
VSGLTDTQSCGVFGLGLGVGVGVGVGLVLGDGLALGAALVLGDGLALGAALLLGDGLALAEADGLALAVGLALGEALAVEALAFALALAAADVEIPVMTAASSATMCDGTFRRADAVAAAAGRLAQTLAVLRRWARCATATVAPQEPVAMMTSPAKTPKVAVSTRRNVTEAPPSWCRPLRGCRPCPPLLINVRMSRLTHSLQSPFDTCCRAGGHSPRGKAPPSQAMHRATHRPKPLISTVPQAPFLRHGRSA